MPLISTRDLDGREATYTDALLAGLAGDGGLFVPKEYPTISKDELKALQGKSYAEIAFTIKRKFVEGTIPDGDLEGLITNAYSDINFPVSDGNIVPIREIDVDLLAQNLSLGPTAAFKDIALQLLAREMNYELTERKEKLVLLGATSGDTGSAAEAAVKNLDTLKLFMLSPEDGMSLFQKAQMAALSGTNIFNVSIQGNFDDCQNLVKELKADDDFSKLGAVNSINWGRITSQIPYFVAGYLQAVSEVGQEVDFAIPTGNFGNALSGYIAKEMGLPIRRLIVATNENDVVAKLINTGNYIKGEKRTTSSPSMDIQVASNYERLAFELLSRDPEKLASYMKKFSQDGRVDGHSYGITPEVFSRNGFFTGSSTKEDRLATIKRLNDYNGTIIDPHTADAVTVAKRYTRQDGVPMIVLETALPVKFEDTIREAKVAPEERDPRFLGIEDRLSTGAFHTMRRDAETLKAYIRPHLVN